MFVATTFLLLPMAHTKPVDRKSSYYFYLEYRSLRGELKWETRATWALTTKKVDFSSHPSSEEFVQNYKNIKRFVWPALFV